MYFGAPSRAARILAYRSSASHCARRVGSFCGRFAFMAKSVFGRLSVLFKVFVSGTSGIQLSIIRAAPIEQSQATQRANSYCKVSGDIVAERETSCRYSASKRKQERGQSL